jgi:hypothetical protein
VTERSNSFSSGVLLLLLLLAAAGLALGWQFSREDGKLVSTHFRQLGLKDWRIGWKWVAYCSEQAAAFRGWKANLGPLEVIHLEATFRPNASINIDETNRLESTADGK